MHYPIFYKKEEFEITSCMNQAKVVNFKDKAIYVTFEKMHMACIFEDNINKIEKAAKELFGQAIKFIIVNVDSTTNVTQFKTDIFQRLSEDNRKYLFSIMRIFDVKESDVKISENDD